MRTSGYTVPPVGHDLNAALLFVHVVDAGSFRGAARALGVPKSSVSRKVSALEEKLGARLLQRTTRRLGLTDIGRTYYQHASTAVAALAEAESAVAEQERAPRGLLRVSTSVNVGLNFLPPIVNEYLDRYPDVEVSLDLSDRMVDLVQERFDLAIRAGPLPDSTLVAHRLGSAPMRVYGSPAYLARRGRPTKPDDLGTHECLAFGAATSMSWTFGVGRGVREIKVKGRLATNNLAILQEAAIAGLGLARLPETLAHAAVEAGALESVLDHFEPPHALLHAVYPSARFVPPKVRAFVEVLRRRLPLGPELAPRGAKRTPPAADAPRRAK